MGWECEMEDAKMLIGPVSVVSGVSGASADWR